MKASQITHLIGIVLISLPCRIVQGMAHSNHTIRIGNVTIDTHMDMCNFTRFYDIVEDVELELDLYNVFGLNREGDSRDRALSSSSEDDGSETNDGSVGGPGNNGLHPQHKEIAEFIERMEDICMNVYITHRAQIDEVVERADAAEDAYELQQTDFEINSKADIDALCDNCELQKQKAVAELQCQITTLPPLTTTTNPNSLPVVTECDLAIFEVTSSIQDQCDMDLLAAYERQEMVVYEAESLYEDQIKGFISEVQALIDAFVAEVGVMEDNLYSELAPSGYRIQKELEREVEILEQRLKEIKKMFSGGLCCEFHCTAGDMMTENDIGHYQTGIRHCYNVAMRKHGFSDTIKNVTLVDQSINPLNATNATTATTAASGGVRRRRLGKWTNNCGACIGGNCGYGCGSNTYGGSGWRRDLTSTDDEEYTGIDLSSAEDVRTDIENCLLDWVNRKIPTIFPYGTTVEARCDSCDIDACGVTSVSVAALGLSG